MAKEFDIRIETRDCPKKAGLIKPMGGRNIGAHLIPMKGRAQNWQLANKNKGEEQQSNIEVNSGLIFNFKKLHVFAFRMWTLKNMVF